MIKRYCDCCQSLIKDNEAWKIRIERNNGCCDLQLYGKFEYDVCPKCARLAQRMFEEEKNTANEVE